MSIPRRLLVHTVTLKQQKGVDRDRNPVYEESEVQNVRVDVTRRLPRRRLLLPFTDTTVFRPLRVF